MQEAHGDEHQIGGNHSFGAWLAGERPVLSWSDVDDLQTGDMSVLVGDEAFGGGKAWVISNYSTKTSEAQQFLDYVTNEANQKAFYDLTQEIPANTKAREYASTQGNELTSAVIAQFADAQPMPNIPQMAEVWEPAATMFFDAASGAKDVKTATSEAVTAIKEAIEQKYSE